MTALQRIDLDSPEPVKTVATTMPAFLADHLTARTRKTFTQRATYVRNAILAAMARDGYLPADLSDGVAS